MIGYITLGIITSLFTNAYATIHALMAQYGYFAIFFLMTLEGSTIPVPSEVVLPLAGIFVADGTLSLLPAYLAALLGSIVGLAVDYYVGYFIGKDIVYKHLKLFRIRQESLDAFDSWFERNGFAAVFLTRLVPVIRTVMSFPAGFARMDPKRFFAYSTLGAAMWDAVLIVFGLKALSTNNAVITLTAIGVFAIILYVIYRMSLKYMMKRPAK